MNEIAQQETPPSARRPWLRWLLIGGSVFGLVGIICCGVAGVLAWQAAQGVQAEAAAMLPTVRGFLAAGARGDAEEALALFTVQQARTVTAEDLARLFRDRPEIFADVADVTIATTRVIRGTAGVTGDITGEIRYADPGVPRTFSAALRKEDEVWRLVSIRFAEGVGP